MRNNSVNSRAELFVNRRNFISRTVGGGFALSLTPYLARFAAAAEQTGGTAVPQSADRSEPWPLEKRVGFALVGLGHLSVDQLIPAFAISKRAKLSGLVSGDSAKAHRLAQENGLKPEAVYDYKTFDRIKDNSDVQVVYVVLPNSMHGEFTVAAARAGKHVLCEKPMEVSVGKCQEMIAACERAKVKLMIAYRIQYEPMNRIIQKMVREKSFGPIKFIESANGIRVDRMGWRLNKELSGSGAVGDLGVYCINTVRFLLGEEPTQVFARSFRPPNDPRFKEIDATTIWQLGFPSGVLANCVCSFDSYPTQSYRLAAERGTFGMDPGFSYRSQRMFAKPDNSSLPQIPETNQFANELDHMADCVANDRQPYTPGEEGLQDQRIIEAIFESAQSGKVIKLPKVDKLDAFRGHEPA
jgi:predicted dehydrogenase